MASMAWSNSPLVISATPLKAQRLKLYHSFDLVAALRLPSMLQTKCIRNDRYFVIHNSSHSRGLHMAKKSKAAKKTAKRRTLRRWTKQNVQELRAYSRARTPIAVISKRTKRTPHALRMKASYLGLPLGHQR